MIEFLKRFKEWFFIKKKLHSIAAKPPKFTEGDIWWCSIGENIGVEINGKSRLFTRPVLVIKKLNRESFIGVPLTSQEKIGKWYVSITHGFKASVALLNQVRCFSVKRLSTKLNTLDETDLYKVKSGLASLILPNVFPSCDGPREIPESNPSITDSENTSTILGQSPKTGYNHPMLNTTCDLSNTEKKATRDGFGLGLVEAAKNDARIVALTADLKESTRVEVFANEYPDRFFEMGVAEQNLVTVAAGMATYGKIPFVTSYATFSPGRNWEQIRTTICINDVPVKVIGCHAGLTVGPDGATHQALEDIAIMRALPNMTVVVPCDATEAYKATLALAQSGKPGYLRLGRSNVPMITTDTTLFEIGKSITVFETETPDVGIIACGSLVYTAILAAQELGNEGINATVINLHTIKPIDREAITSLAKLAGTIVTAEEHQIMGGMGSAVAEVLVEEYPVPIEFVGVRDQFGQSGTPDELMKHYKLDKESIKVAVRDAINRK